MRILLCDDHAMVRYGLRQILADGFPSSTFGEAGDASELLARLAGGSWDLLLLDISMPGRDGLDILKEVSRRWPRLQVLVLTMHPGEHYAIRAFKSGAAGFLNKRAAAEELVTAVRTVASGARFVPGDVAQALAAAQVSEARSRTLESLSNRELQVLRMLAAGKMVKQIAGDLSLSVKTVSTYHVRVLKKLGLGTNADLIRYALENGLVDPT